LTGEVGRHRERRRCHLLRQVDQVGHVFAALAITDSLEQVVGGMEQGIGTRDLIAEVLHLADDIERSSRG
jgi:Mg2+/Co2+ transporter CorC